MSTDLWPSWQRAWRGVGARDDGAELYAALLARYGEAHRHYHALQHVGECLALAEATRGHAQRPDEIEAALWFHDAIYDVKAGDNEQRSAEWAQSAALQAGVAPAVAARLFALVMATLHSAVPSDADAQLLVDIDLSILGAAPARFAEYEQQIRAEYAYVPGWLFRRKRRAILQTFLDRPRIYSTAHFQASHEAAARANLRQALA